MYQSYYFIITQVFYDQNGNEVRAEQKEHLGKFTTHGAALQRASTLNENNDTPNSEYVTEKKDSDHRIRR